MANAPGTFIWYELMTTDADAAARFYGSVIGWSVTGQGDDYRMIGCADGGHVGGVLPLTREMCEGGARPIWLGYHYVTDVDAAIASIQADGGRLLMRRDLPVGQIAMLTDPMGTPFYVMKPVPPPGMPADYGSNAFDPAVPQRVRWNELPSPDLARAKAFYAKQFGFRFDEVLPLGGMGDYCFIDHEGLRLGAIMQKPPGDPAHASWLFYFDVPSVTGAKRAIESGGGRVLMGPHQVPGGGFIVIAIDPQGARFGVTGPQ